MYCYCNWTAIQKRCSIKTIKRHRKCCVDWNQHCLVGMQSSGCRACSNLLVVIVVDNLLKEEKGGARVAGQARAVGRFELATSWELCKFLWTQTFAHYPLRRIPPSTWWRVRAERQWLPPVSSVLLLLQLHGKLRLRTGVCCTAFQCN